MYVCMYSFDEANTRKKCATYHCKNQTKKLTNTTRYSAMKTKVNKHCEIISNHLFGIIKQKVLRVMSANT